MLSVNKSKEEVGGITISRPKIYYYSIFDYFCEVKYLAAERIFIGAEKGNEKTAIEIKTFSSQSDLSSFEDAIWQFLMHHFALSEKEPE